MGNYKKEYYILMLLSLYINTIISCPTCLYNNKKQIIKSENTICNSDDNNLDNQQDNECDCESIQS